VRGFIAKNFGLRLKPDGRLEAKESLPEACFKKSDSTELFDLQSAQAFGASVLRMVSKASRLPPNTNRPNWKSLPSAPELRSLILENNSPWVGLSDLLDVCWHHQIPVVYLPSMPTAKSKMHGMVVMNDENPAILLSKKATNDHPAWVLFTLAHEMGHIFHGHLEEDGNSAIIEEEINDAKAIDAQEAEANNYATALLSGGEKLKISIGPRAAQFAGLAELYGKSHQVDPGHVVLNAVNHSKFPGGKPWTLGISALKHIDDKGGAEAQFKKFLKKNISRESLKTSSYEFLEKLNLV
jgi:hypothetical protein